jgi:hypothetical protein
MIATSPLPVVPANAAPPLQPYLRPGALARLLDPSPPYVTGLSDDFLNGRYGRHCEEAA